MPSFLIDECVPRDVCEALAGAGHKVVLVRDRLLGSGDEQVLAFARDNGLVVFTEDRRFGFIAMGAGQPGGVVVLMMGDASPAAKAARVASAMPSIAASLTNAVTVIGPASVRRRAL